jgi:hypothetical protein
MGNRWGTNGEQMGRDGNEEISLRATWDQGRQILSQQGGFQVSRRDQEREQKGISKGREKARGESANVYKPNVYIMIVCKCQNDCQSYVCK